MADADTTRFLGIVTSEGSAKSNVKPRIDKYESYFTKGTVEDRKKAYMEQVNTFYDLSTAFMEYAWSKSFHFAPSFKGETFDASIARYEHTMAVKIGAKPGMKILDIGCGVGGPARSICRFSGAKVIGINNNEYQLGRARAMTEEAGLSHLLSYVQSDFMKVGELFDENSIDGIFSFEAIAHAPDKKLLYEQLYKLLKPGAWFVTAEWAMTPNYDPNNKAQAHAKYQIELGNGLPDIESTTAIKKHFVDAGFANIEAVDWADPEYSQVPWYAPLDFAWTPTGLARSRPGHYITHYMLTALECMKLAAPGTTKVSEILMETGIGLVVGGKSKSFTPMYILLGQKPL